MHIVMKRQLNEYIIVPSQAFQTTWLALHSTEAIIEKKKFQQFQEEQWVPATSLR